MRALQQSINRANSSLRVASSDIIHFTIRNLLISCFYLFRFERISTVVPSINIHGQGRRISNFLSHGGFRQYAYKAQGNKFFFRFLFKYSGACFLFRLRLGTRSHLLAIEGMTPLSFPNAYLSISHKNEGYLIVNMSLNQITKKLTHLTNEKIRYRNEALLIMKNYPCKSVSLDGPSPQARDLMLQTHLQALMRRATQERGKNLRNLKL